MKWRAYVRINLEDLEDWDFNDYTYCCLDDWNGWDEAEPSGYGGVWYKVEYDDGEGE